MVLFLETCTAEVSSGRAFPGEGKPSPVEEAARKDSAVHVSLSSDSLVKQPGNHGDPPSRCAGKPPKPKPSDRNRTTGHLISEELRRRAIAPESGAARRCGGFIWAGRRACQHQMPQISPQLRAVEQRRLSLGSRALPGGPAPHWRHIPPALFTSGKGQWSRYESQDAWLLVDAPKVARHRAACVPLI